MNLLNSCRVLISFTGRLVKCRKVLSTLRLQFNAIMFGLDVIGGKIIFFLFTWFVNVMSHVAIDRIQSAHFSCRLHPSLNRVYGLSDQFIEEFLRQSVELNLHIEFPKDFRILAISVLIISALARLILGFIHEFAECAL